MTLSTSIDLLKQKTAELVAQELRSDSAVIARLAVLIADAVQTGHSHRSIHQAITSGGLCTSWTNYRIALGRARKAQRARRPASEQSPAPAASTPFALPPGISREARREVVATAGMPQRSAGMRDLSGTSSATRVMDALQQARDVAHSKDYGQIGRDLYRQQQRDQRQKDRS